MLDGGSWGRALEGPRVPPRRPVSPLLCIALLSACGLAPLSCQQSPPAFPAALVVVDTDLAVPEVISNLRVDVFDREGRWIDEREFAFANAQPWPVSFGVVVPHDLPSVDVMLRLRGFAAVRDYRGERFIDKAPYAPLSLPASLKELCASAPELPAGKVLVQRAGPSPLFEEMCDGSTNASGSVAAHLEVKTAGRYRFEVLTSLLRVDTFAFGTALHLVRRCETPADSIICSQAVEAIDGRFGNFEVDLEPGKYSLVTANVVPSAAGEVALRWTEASRWGKPELPDPAVAEEPEPVALTLHRTAPAPLTEPSPESTVDRLVRLRLRSGEPLTTRITLRGACAGAMAKLSITDDRVDAAQSETCVDDPRTRGPVREGAQASDAAPAANGSAVGTFAAEACVPDDSTDDVVCVPGGSFLLGRRTSLAFPNEPAEVPLRITATKRFFIDRRELTVARYRAAVARGLRLDRRTYWHLPKNHEGPLDLSDNDRASTFSETPAGREDFPLNNVIWEAARIICQFLGGDLPTEAQWERAATFSPEGKRAYPWGDDVATCRRTAIGQPTTHTECRRVGPVAVTDPALANDVSFLGIHGLGGNVSEWVLGTSGRYDGPCWRGADVIDPVCFEPADATRVHRGGAWSYPTLASRADARFQTNTVFWEDDLGFRCAYSSPPARP